MSADNSILGRVMESKHAQGGMYPEEVLDKVIREHLAEREREILNLRYGLSQKTHTLDAIGKKFFITRERVRQITKQAINKLNKIKSEIEELKNIDRQLRDLLERRGGVRTHESLARDYYATEASEAQKAYLRFFLEHLSDYLEPAPMGDGWQLTGLPGELHDHLYSVVRQALEQLKKPQAVPTLHKHLNEDEAFQTWRDRFTSHHGKDHEDVDWPGVLEAYLELAEDLKQNPFTEWGLKHWPSVNPRRISDKIYLVLKRHDEPLHFEDITKQINELQFDRKKAHAPTVHNELILNDNFVLIGRGIYALKEWGYIEGTVADVLEHILRQTEAPLSREVLVEKIMKQRQVKEGTIVLALNVKERFTKNADGTYSLTDDSDAAQTGENA